jgi:ABC-type amino acid transport substrate-binding protein
VRKDSDIKSIADLKGKRVPSDYVNQKVLDVLSQGTLANAGLSYADVAFKDAANRALRTMIRSGAFEEIYQRWFQSPVAPAGLNLKLPMSEALRDRIVAAKAAPG